MNLTSFRRSSTNSMKLARFFIAVFCGLSSLCFGSEESDNQAYIDSVADDLGIDRGGLSLMVAGLTATGSSSGNITNDVASILAVLEGLSFTYGSARIRTTEYPFANQNTQLGRLLNLLFSSSSNPGTAPVANDSYLYQIRELIKTFPTNSADYSQNLTAIESQTRWLYDIWYELNFHQHNDLVDIADVLDDSYLSFGSFTNWLYSFEYSQGLWNTHIDDSQLNDLLYGLNAIESSTPFQDSSWTSFEGNLDTALTRIENDLSQIEYNTASSANTLSSFLPDIFAYSQHMDGDLHDIIEGLSSWVASNTASSYSNLALESSAAYSGAEYSDPTNTVDWVNIPAQIAQDADTSDMEDTAQDGGDALGVRLSAFEALVPPGDAEIVVIPEFTIGGIHVREYRASLDTSITSVAHAVMVFIWYVMLFVALFRLGEGEFAFYASLGRNWSMSGGFHQKGD